MEEFIINEANQRHFYLILLTHSRTFPLVLEMFDLINSHAIVINMHNNQNCNCGWHYRPGPSHICLNVKRFNCNRISNRYPRLEKLELPPPKNKFPLQLS